MRALWRRLIVSGLERARVHTSNRVRAVFAAPLARVACKNGESKRCTVVLAARALADKVSTNY